MLQTVGTQQPRPTTGKVEKSTALTGNGGVDAKAGADGCNEGGGEVHDFLGIGMCICVYKYGYRRMSRRVLY